MRPIQSLICGVLSLFLFALLPAGAAHATPSSQQRALARELYGKGQQLFREGDYVAAEHSFEEAYRIAPTPVVLLSIAECQVRTEQFEKAAETLETYLREKPDAKDSTEVRTQIETLRGKPATLTVSSNIAGADIWVDNNDTGMSTPADLSLAPGVHTVTVVREGYVRTEQSVRLAPAGREVVRFTMMPEARAPVAAAPQAPAAPVEEESSGRHFGPGFWAATGVGVAALGSAVTLGALALVKKKDYDKHPTEGRADQGERFALFADVSYGIAGAAAVTAVVVYLTSGKSKSEDEAAATPQAWLVAPALSRDGAGFAARRQF